MFKNTGYKNITEEEKHLLSRQELVVFNLAYMQHGALMWAPFALSDEETKILLRFAKVFEQTYTRFLDLQKAEAQAREAQIELALERVRARTMAMQKSDELAETAYLFFQQFKELGQNPEQFTIGLINEKERMMEFWHTWQGSLLSGKVQISIDEPHVGKNIYKVWKTQKNAAVIDISGTELQEYNAYRKKQLAKANAHAYDDFLGAEKRRVIHVSSFSKGIVSVASHEPQPLETIQLLERFATVFDQTYTRFLDLQKAETQAREAQIEAALERVRSRSIAMRKSEEIAEIAAKIFGELRQLDLSLNRVLIWTFNDTEKYSTWWSANPEVESTAESYRIDYNDNPVFINYLKAWQRRDQIHLFTLSGDTKKTWEDHLFKHTELSRLPMEVKNGMSSESTLYTISVISDYGLMMSGSLEPLSDTSIDIIQRFGRVFQQSYTRYLDVQKAEAQAREAKIEASLERVRSRSTGMQKSDELRDVIQVIYEQLVHLGIDIFGAGFTMDYKEREDWQIWAADIANLSPTLLHIPYFDHPYWNAWNDAKRKGLETLAYTMEFEEKNRFALEFGKYMPDLTPEANELVLSTPGYTVSNVFLQHVTLYIDRFTVEPFSDADNAILMRFGNVFEQTYTRFKDLEKAEAQAREAQIEASLERVRSKTMAMHNSNDVGETVACMFGEFVHLSISTNRCGILIFKNENLAEVWTAKSNGEGRSSLIIGSLDLSRHRLLNSAYEALIAGESQHQYLLKGDDLMKYYQNINDQKSYPVRFDLSSLPEKEYHTDYYFPEGAVFAFTNEPIPAEHSKIFKRFAGVFGQTYRRYLDLMRAEAQAREATIEAALERVRAKAMAMHNSADLTLASGAVFTELRNLGINPVRCGVGVLSKESRRAQLFSSASSETGGSLPLEGWVELSGHPVLNAIYESWLTGEDYFPELQGESMITYYEQLSKGLSVKAPTTDQYQTRYGNFLQISVGCLYAWSAMPFDESQIKILKRFASILDLTFRRYFELQIAEANTKEAIRQASLDRVRAEIASMRTIGDLDRITPLIWRELTTLGVPFVRCGVFIMDDEKELIHTFLSSPDGKAIAAFHLPYGTQFINESLKAWQRKETYRVHWGTTEFSALADILVKGNQIERREQYLSAIPQEGIFLHFLPFLQGMLYVGHVASLGTNDLNLIQSVADAFSTAYARYEDFNKLEAAKQRVDNTLTELKQAQQQLVQSEKMASLGELTAGIAHEIQNPLNFVNNFSEVSNEILDDVKEEIKKGHVDDAINIVNDLKDNLAKISHHGQRASSIVKSMLEHSRKSSNEKILTDINTICDEYVRLAYQACLSGRQGMRAKDSKFNCDYKLDLDPSLPKMNVIPQDISRVILNLVNNAFYACNERKLSVEERKQMLNQKSNNDNHSGNNEHELGSPSPKDAGQGVRGKSTNVNDLSILPTATSEGTIGEGVKTNDYQPLVQVSTKNHGNKIEIRIQDNGTGIPDHIKDKIFQPFFTTKPTGQGTGLGLSLAYDIVKAHGGDVRVEATEGEGSSFIIQLPIKSIE